MRDFLMETANMNLDIIWWITVVELPALAALFWMNWSGQKDTGEALDLLETRLNEAKLSSQENLSAYKLEVAKSYVTISYLKDVERRLTAHLVRIESKLGPRVSQGD